MDNVRRNVQKKLSDAQRRDFKRSRRLLLAHREMLTDEEKKSVDVMLHFSNKLLQAYSLKGDFYYFMAASDRAEAERRLKLILLFIPNF